MSTPTVTAITTKTDQVATTKKKKYINDSATAQAISNELNQELGDYAYFGGLVQVWVQTPLPGGGTQMQAQNAYKSLRGVKNGYNVGGWTIVTQPDPIPDTEDTDTLSETTSPATCSSCDMGDSDICFDISHSDFPEVLDEPEGGGVAAGIFNFIWQIDTSSVTDANGNPVTYLGGTQAGNLQYLRPVNIVMGVKTDEEHDVSACNASCICDPCGAAGYFIDPWQCTATNQKSRPVVVPDNITCYECYFA